MDWNKIAPIANIIVAIGTIILALVAIFGRSIGRWLRRPKLKIKVISEPPHCHKTMLTKPGGGAFLVVPIDCYYFRIWVENNGKTSAKNVEVFAKRLLRYNNQNKPVTVNTFIPINLKWTHLGQMLFPEIHSGTGKHCDIFHVVHPDKRTLFEGEYIKRGLTIGEKKIILSFDTIVQSNRKGYLQPPGKYKLEIVVAAGNAKPISKNIFIETDGKWYSNEEKMLTEGFVFK
jgi:hypothetical protein